MIKNVREEKYKDSKIINKGISIVSAVDTYIDSQDLPESVVKLSAPLKESILELKSSAVNEGIVADELEFTPKRTDLIESVKQLLEFFEEDRKELELSSSRESYDTYVIKPMTEFLSKLESFVSELSEEEALELTEVFGLQPVNFKGEVGTAARNLLNAEKSITDDLKLLRRAIQKNTPRTQLPATLKQLDAIAKIFDATFDKATKELKSLVRDISTTKRK
ncbi:hypothetical protein LIS04_12 [Listeria phage LIS04]|nr:hypothetical protein LIS04_12 [Listeria phage LIS04]